MLLVGFKYYLSTKCLLTNGSMKNGKSALKLQWNNRLKITVRHLSHFAQPVKWLWQQKSIYYDRMRIVDYVKISWRLSDKTKRVVSVKSVHTMQFLHQIISHFISFGRHTVCSIFHVTWTTFTFNTNQLEMVLAYVMWLWLIALLMCTLKWLSSIEIQCHKGLILI